MLATTNQTLTHTYTVGARAPFIPPVRCQSAGVAGVAVRCRQTCKISTVGTPHPFRWKSSKSYCALHAHPRALSSLWLHWWAQTEMNTYHWPWVIWNKSSRRIFRTCKSHGYNCRPFVRLACNWDTLVLMPNKKKQKHK